MSGLKKIPSEETIERALREMREEECGLDQVCEDVLARFGELGRLYEIFVLPQLDVDFRAYVFFHADKEVEAAHQTGLSEQIVDFVYEALERVGRGKRGDIEVAFEFDSDEHVKRSFEGDYSLRLRA